MLRFTNFVFVIIYFVTSALLPFCMPLDLFGSSYQSSFVALFLLLPKYVVVFDDRALMFGDISLNKRYFLLFM